MDYMRLQSLCVCRLQDISGTLSQVFNHEKTETAYFKITSRKREHIHTKETLLNLFFSQLKNGKHHTEREQPVPN